MGKTQERDLIPFTYEHVKNKELVIKMLTYEEEYGKSEIGQELYRTKLLNPYVSLEPIYVVHRVTLAKFGFDTSEESVKNYRKIFSYYYNSPTDYDNDVISASYYMRNNKLMFYTLPKPIIGDNMTNVKLLNLDGTNTTLFEELDKHQYKTCFVGAFSTS